MRSDVYMQQLATLVSWHTLDHVTTQFGNFVTNTCWDLVCFMVEVSILFVQYMGDKLLDQRINIKFLVKLKIPLTCTTCDSRFIWIGNNEQNSVCGLRNVKTE